MTQSGSGSTPAQTLVGVKLANGWTVEKLVERDENATGGTFSCSYIVRSSDGRKAFLKAMDYVMALRTQDPAKELQILTQAYIFERYVNEKCKSRHLSRIVRVIDSGTIPSRDGEPSSVVQYLIFELADGDIRSFMDYGKSFEAVWLLRNMHQVSAALQQLHNIEIAHQDLKPSNVLVFNNGSSKLADLGRASDHRRSSPYDSLDCAGDWTYAPPELLYGHVSEDWRVRRLGGDIYLLGSLVVFLCTGISMTHLLFERLDNEHHFQNWNHTYYEVLPYLQRCFLQIVRELRQEIRNDFAGEISQLVTQLCNPDYRRRGHPRNIVYNGNQYSVERYVSIFDRLARRAELSLKPNDLIREVN